MISDMPSRRQGAFVGLLSLIVSLTAASIVAALAKVDGPIVVVGNRFIDATPKWLKNFAVENFGTNDKAILLAGITVTLILAAALVGIAALRRFSVAVVGTAVLAIVGIAAATTRSSSRGVDWLPPLVGSLAGLGAFWVLLRRPRTAEGPAESPLAFDRRRFLTGAGALGVTSVGMALSASAVRRGQTKTIATSRVTATADLPKLPSAAVAVPSSATLPEVGYDYITNVADFYRIDTALSIPQVDPSTWKLTIKGLVTTPLTITYAELLAMPMIERVITISCVSNEVGGDLIGNARWQGVSLAELLKKVGVKPEATQLASKSHDGWTCGFPTALAMDGRDAMIAVAMNGQPLNAKHGFPARLIVPGIYGYVSATKWLTEITLTTMEDFDGYWIDKGWSKLAPVKTQSRIDVPRRSTPLVPGKVAVAGVAWAMHRGVDKVEVRVDDGAWVEAKLADEPTIDAWRQWVYAWDATPGRHRIAVRATDGAGIVQTSDIARSDPNGATGWHTINVNVGA
jgi:DMSO/TMAO reductase YedYZ molybdopterin-dependent catalytic subunit